MVATRTDISVLWLVYRGKILVLPDRCDRNLIIPGLATRGDAALRRQTVVVVVVVVNFQ